MPRLNTEQIRELADEWGRLELQIVKKAEGLEAALQPVLEQHQAEIDAVAKKYRCDKQRARQAEIESEVQAALKGRKDTVIEGEVAEAIRRTETRVGPRVIDFTKFWRAAKEYGEAAVDCINVQVARAEQLLGKKKVDAISTKKESVETVYELRLKD